MKKRIQTIHSKVLVDGALGELQEHEVLVDESGNNVVLKEIINGSIKTISSGIYQAKQVKATGKSIDVTPDAGYDALTKVVVTPSDRVMSVLDNANVFYKLTGDATGGNFVVNNITGGEHVLVCSEPTTAKTDVSVYKVSDSEVTVAIAANEVKYMAFYSSETPTGTGAHITKETSTLSDIKTKLAEILL